MPWVPVAPSTNVKYTVSSVELFSEAVIVVAKVAVSAFPVTLPVSGPEKASDVTVPSKKASLNSLSDLPKSIILSAPGYNAPSSKINCFSLSA